MRAAARMNGRLERGMEILPQRTQRTELKPNIQHPTSNIQRGGRSNLATKIAENTEKKGLGGKWGLDREDLALLFVLFVFFCG
jgi:hypothetical protein